MQNKNFILGVGCQKGGTTWLYRQLSKSSSVNLGFKKEYHVWWAYTEGKSNIKIKEISNEIAKLANKPINDKAKHELSRKAKMMSFHADINNYLDYFEWLYIKDEKITTVGDITPFYAAISADGYNIIKKKLEERGFQVKVIFLMRDPIERCWSAYRMEKKINKDTRFKSDADALQTLYKDKWYEYRSRYNKTINNLEKVFDPSDIYYGFYEELFEPSSLNDIKNFLNLSDFEPDVQEVFNTTNKKGELPHSLCKDIAQFYKVTYEFCDDRFNLKSKNIWEGYELLN